MRDRGPGELIGLRQTGEGLLRFPEYAMDVRFLDAVRRDAAAILSRDPLLSRPQYHKLAAAVRRIRKAGGIVA